MKIKAIIFDIGGVLCPEPYKKDYMVLSKIFGIKLDDFKKSRKNHIKRALRKRKPIFEYEVLIAKDLNINPKKLITHWQRLRLKSIKLKKSSQKLLQKLSKEYFLGTLTNVTPSHDIIRSKQKIDQYFQLNLKSCDLGISKPCLAMFRKLVKELNKKRIGSSEVIFVDDNERNLVVARKLKINTILFKSNPQLKRDLRRLGIKV